MIDVATYFSEKYHRLEYPYLPCVEVGASKMKIPIEVCRIARVQRYEKELNAEQRAAMIDCTRSVSIFSTLNRLTDRFHRNVLNEQTLKKFWRDLLIVKH